VPLDPLPPPQPLSPLPLTLALRALTHALSTSAATTADAARGVVARGVALAVGGVSVAVWLNEWQWHSGSALAGWGVAVRSF
jgi:hypothetical protein